MVHSPGITHSAAAIHLAVALALANGGSLAGIFTGNPHFTGSPIFDNLVYSGPLTLISPGVFTNTQMNLFNQSLLNSCSPSTEFSTEQAGNFATDAVDGCVATPSSGTVHQSNGIAGYATNLSTSINAVGGYFSGRALANGVHVWGSNSLVQDSGFTNTVLVGHEIDVNTTASAATPAWGLELNGAQNSPGNTGGAQNMGRVGVVLAGGNWNTGFSCGLTTLNQTANYANGGACVLMQPVTTGNSQFSQGVQFVATNSGGGHPYGVFYEDPANVLTLLNTPLKLSPPTFSSLPTCAAGIEGAMLPVTDSSTITWGATITGSSTNHVLAYCDGTNWTVAAK
jgi:hypothetical protein